MQTIQVNEQGRSTFVTVLSWILIVFAAFGVFGGLMQAVMVTFVFPEVFPPIDGQSIDFPQDGAFAAMRVLIGVFLAFEVFFLYSSISLLRRRNWARRVIVVLLSLGVLWNLLIVVGGSVGVFIGLDIPSEVEEFPQNMETFFRVAIGAFVVFAGAMTVLFVWLIRRLRSAAVQAEFGVARAIRMEV